MNNPDYVKDHTAKIPPAPIQSGFPNPNLDNEPNDALMPSGKPVRDNGRMP